MAEKYPAICSTGEKQKSFRRYVAKFTLRGEVLWYVGSNKEDEDKWRRVLFTDEEKNLVFQQCHDSPMGAHVGRKRTKKKISSVCYWRGMDGDVDRWIDACDKCQRFEKVKTMAPELRPIKVTEPWHLLGMDLFGPLKPTMNGYQYVLTVTDYYTKWPEAYPLRNKTAAEVAARPVDTFYRLGMPTRILSDQGREFINQVNERIFQLVGIEHSVSAAYHPQTNGLDEKTNQTVKTAISKLINDNQDNWDEFLNPVMFGLRTAQQATTKYTPFYLMLHRRAKLPFEIAHLQDKMGEIFEVDDKERDEYTDCIVEKMTTLHEKVLSNIEAAQEKQKKQYREKKSKGVKTFELNPGDKVLRLNAQKQGRQGGKTEAEWLGPYIIDEITNRNMVKLTDVKTTRKLAKGVAYCQLKPYREATRPSANSAGEVIGELQSRVSNPPPLSPSITTSPSVSGPITNQPPISQPAINLPPVLQPKINQPSVSQPAINLPPVSQPIVNQPVVLPPVSQPIINPPLVSQPVNNLPPVSPGIIHPPSVAQPVTNQPPIFQHVISPPSVLPSVTDQPPVTNSTVAQPTLADCEIVSITKRLRKSDKIPVHPSESQDQHISEMKKILSSSTEWLNDTVINHCQFLMKQQHPHIDGLQDVGVTTTGVFVGTPDRDFVQILNIRESHWIVASNLNCNVGTVRIYDSMSSSIDQNAKKSLAWMLYHNGPTMKVVWPSVHKQNGGSDCGLFAVANAFALCAGDDPANIIWDQGNMRCHLSKCLDKGKLVPFPVRKVRRGRCLAPKVLSVELYCHCRQPYVRDTLMVQCQECRRWYHSSCESIPEDACLTKYQLICSRC